MKQFLTHWLAPLLCAALVAPTAVSAAGRLDKPVVQESIPTPGEAVAKMAARKRAAEKAADRDNNPLLYDVTDASSEEMDRIEADPIPPGLMGLQETDEPTAVIAQTTAPTASPSQAKPAQPIATAQAASKRTTATSQTASAAPLTQKTPTAPQTNKQTVKKATNSQQQQLANLTAKRTRGEISGDAYLTERHRIIYGQPAPTRPQKTAQPSGPSVEQRLDALTQLRKRGEMSGEAYLAARQQIISGGKP